MIKPNKTSATRSLGSRNCFTTRVSPRLEFILHAFHNARMARCAQSLPAICVGAAVTLALVLPGCASTREKVGGWFEPTPTSGAESPAAKASVYYAGADGLKIYSEPSSSSTLVGTLSLHEQVGRTRVERGYAYVTSASSGITGWVNNADLIWRLPAERSPTAPARQKAEPEPATPAQAQPQTPATAGRGEPQEPTLAVDPAAQEAATPPQAQPGGAQGQPVQEPAAAPAAAQPPAPTPPPATDAEPPPSGVNPSVFDAY
jgi:hypothetical protein